MSNNKKTHEEFIKEVFNLVGNEYSVLGRYEGRSKYITIKHNVCGRVYDVRAGNFLSGNRCRECSREKASENRKKTHDKFVKEVESLGKGEYIVITRYIDNKTPVKIEHKVCGEIFDITPERFKAGRRCKMCTKKKQLEKMSKTHDDFVKEVHDIVGDEYSVLGDYINNNTPITLRHNKCGKIYDARPGNFLSGMRCKDCVRKKITKSQTKTHEDFIKEVYELVGDEYTVLGKYKKTKELIKIRHNKCIDSSENYTHTYNVTPTNFLSGKRCPKCAKPNYNMNDAEFKRKVYELVGNEYTFIGEYVNTEVKIDVIHNVCGRKYSIEPIRFLKGAKCMNCTMPNYNRDTNKFKKEVQDLVGDEYLVLGEYVAVNEKIRMVHRVCGKEYEVLPSAFLRGNRCPSCNGRIRKTTEQFKDEVYNLVGEEYTVLGEYINGKSKIRMRHNKCGNEYDVQAQAFLRGTRCGKCFGKNKKTTEQFKEEVYNLVGEEYTVIGEYTKALEKISMKHEVCNSEYDVVASSFLAGNRCPKCTISKGHAKIKEFLLSYNIKFEEEYSFADCYYKDLDRPLRYDFFIKTNSDKIVLCEFDGEQHFRPVDFFGGEEGYENTVKRDNIKNEYCRKNEIVLIRIPYWDIDKVGKILGKKLYKLGILNTSIKKEVKFDFVKKEVRKKKKKKLLKDSEVLEIRKKIMKGIPDIKIQEEFGIAESTFSAIKSCRSWKWLKVDGYDPNMFINEKHKKRYSDEDCKKIAEYIKAGYKYKEISEKMNTTESFICKIKKMYNISDDDIDYSRRNYKKDLSK